MTVFLPRRAALTLSLATIAPGVRAQDAAQAAPFIQQAGTELASLIAASDGVADRRRRLVPFLERVVDVDGVGRFCLGRFWSVATPEQRAEYLKLYRLVLVNGVAAQLGEYRQGEVRVITARPDKREDGIYVPTTVERPGNKPNRVVWVVVPSGGTFRITDVIAEGISLRLTQRSDYVAFLSRNGNDIDVLLRAMQTQVGASAAAG